MKADLLFFFLSWIILLVLRLKTHPQIQGHLYFPCLLLQEFTFKSVTWYELTLVQAVRSVSASFFCMCMSL